MAGNGAGGAAPNGTVSITAVGSSDPWYDQVWAYIQAHYVWILPVGAVGLLIFCSCCCLCVYKTFHRKKPYADITGKTPPPEPEEEIPPPPSEVFVNRTHDEHDGVAIIGEDHNASADETRPFVSPHLEPNFAVPVEFYRSSVSPPRRAPPGGSVV